MTSQENSKVRKVRCPKCRQVLRELVEVPIYQCGGCGAILQAKKRGKDFQDTESREADPKNKNEVENTSENPITEESCIDKFPKRVDSTTDDRIESLGEINESRITCHEIEGSTTEARARTEEEEGKLPLYQYGTEDQDKDPENSASNEILSFSELNQHESNSLVPQVHNHESESFLSSLEIKTQSRHSSSEFNCDGEKEVSESDLENATEKSSAGKKTESPDSSKDNSNGGKKEFENELQNSSENPSTDNEELEEVHAGDKKQGKDFRGTGSQACEADLKLKNEVENTSENPITEDSCIDEFPETVDSTTDDRMESLGEINESSQLYGADAITCHEIEGSTTEAGARTEEEEGKLPLYQYGTEDQDKDPENSASNEILSFSELNQHESNSSVPQVHNHESESFLSSLELKTQSRHSSSEYNCDGEKEVSENDLENATEKSSAGIETKSPGSSEDNSDGGKKEFENELQNSSENPSTDNEKLEEVHAGGKSSADGRREWIGSVNSCHAIADLSLESIAPTEADKCEISFNRSGTDAHYTSEYDIENSGEVSISNKVLSSPKLNHLENDLSVPGYHMYESGKSLLSSPKEVTGSGYSSPSNNDEGKNEHPSQVEEVDDNRESLLILPSANAETFLDNVTKDQIITAGSFSSEGNLPSLDNPMSPHREMQQVEGGMNPGFQYVSSDDTLENTSHFYARGDLGVTLRSLTARKYYACDGSASSNETEDQLPDRRFQLLKGSLEDKSPNSTKVLPERSEYIMNHVTRNDSELQCQLMNSGSSLQGKKYSTTKVSRWHQDELLESARYRSPVRNRMRNETDDYHSRLLFSKYSSQADQGNSSSSNYGQNDFFALPDNLHELHRLELLRMVYELQNQLKNTQLSEGMPHGRFLTRPYKGKEHHFAENRKDYSHLAYHNCHGKYRRDITWLKNRELSRMVLPEDPIHYMHRVDCSCLRCCRQEQYHSAQQPPHGICYREEQSMTNARETSRPYRSASSIPHHYATSEFSLWSQDMKPDDQWYNKQKEARNHHIAKRHFQPIAGGAPIVACYHCSEILQLPAESLLFKRRCHQLKCGACSKVLKFSVENRIHVVQYDLIPRTPLPSLIAENTRVIKKSDLALAYRGSDRPLAEPEASSANSQSFSRSHSTGDNFSDTPSKFSSASSFKTPEEGIKSKSTRESVYKNNSSVESFKSARSSFMMPDSEHSGSESEVESPLPGSALHKLMGYSSIRRLVFQ